jgi:hypothetical protein
MNCARRISRNFVNDKLMTTLDSPLYVYVWKVFQSHEMMRPHSTPHRADNKTFSRGSLNVEKAGPKSQNVVLKTFITKKNRVLIDSDQWPEIKYGLIK